jgi:hypothetical protein
MNEEFSEHSQYKIKEDLRRRCGDDTHLFHLVIEDFHRWVTLADAYCENYGQYQKILTNDIEGMRPRDALSYGFVLTLLTLFSFFFLDQLVFELVLIISVFLFWQRVTRDELNSPKVLEILRRHFDLAIELKKLNSEIDPDKLVRDYLGHPNTNYEYRYAAHVVVRKYVLPD